MYESLIDGFLQTSGKTLITQWGEASTLQSSAHFQIKLSASEKNSETKWVKGSRQGKYSTFSLFQILLKESWGASPNTCWTDQPNLVMERLTEAGIVTTLIDLAKLKVQVVLKFSWCCTIYSLLLLRIKQELKAMKDLMVERRQ